MHLHIFRSLPNQIVFCRTLLKQSRVNCLAGTCSMSHSSFHKRYKSGKQTLRVLIDMDQVLCDFEAHFLAEFKRQFPEEPYIELEQREGFWIHDQYDKMKPGLSVKCAKIYNAKGFFSNLPEIPGAVDAAKEIWNMEGIDTFICTSPIKNYKYCLKEKFQWVEEHLGREWLERILIVKDKTMANGHILIDDKVDITGANPFPSWEHVVFSTYHNKRMDLHGRRVLNNWTDGSWRDLIADCMKKI